jgi:hypothetical protein
MSELSQANAAYRRGDFIKASSLYVQFVENNKNYPSILLNYARQQIQKLQSSSDSMPCGAPNIIVTSCNAKFFPSLLLLVHSITEHAWDVVDEVLIFDFGLEDWQRAMLANKNKLILFSPCSEILGRPELKRFDIKDASAYFFKVYAFHFWRNHSKVASSGPANCLWIDCGIELKQSPLEIFRIISQEGAFFLSHSDVHSYYSDVQDRLVNVLSPALCGSGAGAPVPDVDALLKPYVKASIFGLQFEGPWDRLIGEHYRLCTETEVLFDPRKINDKAKMSHWLDTTAVAKRIAELKLNNSGKYLHGRHEQTVWGYLAAINNITIRDSDPYNYTCAPGSGWLNKHNYSRVMRPKLTRGIQSYRQGMVEFLSKHSDKTPESINGLYDEALIEEYLSTSEAVYIDQNKYQGLGFPLVPAARSSISLLSRGSTSRIDEFKYAGHLLRHASNVRDDIFILMGNGPSLASVDFETLRTHHTFGLNAAYRAYHKLNFWPKYFGCFDALVCGHHAPEFKKLIMDSPIEKFFFINFDDNKKPNFPEPEIQNHSKFQRIDFRYRTSEEKQRDDILAAGFEPFMDMRTSGTNTIQCALLMGYRKILLLGCDANYVEYVDGAAKINNNPLKIKMDKTPEKNPNYWFDDYQQKGDVFNKPNLQISQLPAWDKLASTLDHLQIPVQIYNCALGSNIECFTKLDYENAVVELKKTPVKRLAPFHSAKPKHKISTL